MGYYGSFSLFSDFQSPFLANKYQENKFHSSIDKM